MIAIIAILAAILFPVFARAREKARQTTCSSNQRQLAAAILMYAQDHVETFPNSTNIWRDCNVDQNILLCPSACKSLPVGYLYNSYMAGRAIGLFNSPDPYVLSGDSTTPGSSINCLTTVQQEGNAAWNPALNCDRLTPAVVQQVGDIWYLSPQDIYGGFSSNFTYQITGGSDDGFVFVMQNNALGA